MSDNDVKIKVTVDGADTAAAGLRGVGDGAKDADSKIGTLVSGGLKGAGVALAGFAVGAAAAGTTLAIGATKAYSDYQQSLGGIQKLFGSAAGTMQQYASEAYKTAGLSANDYMQQATSFSAALINGLHGNQAAAAQEANKAIVDMSDNANIFGSNIEDIQNAYQGFAKQNYTMLDNLKLGYGGTAAGMAQLVNASGVMGSSFTATAQNINSVSFDKIVDAIHTVQDRMGIAGDTSREAADTIAGSVVTMKAAWTNFIAGLADPDADITGLANELVGSFQNVLKNISPVVDQIGKSITTLGPQLAGMGEDLVKALASALPAAVQAGVGIINGLVQGVAAALPGLLTALLPVALSIVQTFVQLGPQLITAGAQAILQLAGGLMNAMPTLIPAIIQGVLGMAQALINAAPLLVSSGIELIMGLVQGLIASIPSIIAALPALIQGIVTFITTSVPDILDAGIALFQGIITALPQIITQLVAVLPTLITSIITALLGAIPLIITAGITLLTSLVTALPQIITAVVAALPKIITAVITAVVGAVPQLVQAGITLFIALVKALPQIIVAIVAAIPQIIAALVKGIAGAIPSIMAAGVQLLVALVKNAPAIISAVVGIIPSIISGLTGAIGNGIGDMASAGADLIHGLWTGISNTTQWIIGKIGGFTKDVLGAIKGFFGIHSPSKLMADEVGKFLPAGIGVGIELNADAAIKPIKDLSAQILTEAQGLNTTVAFTHDATLTQNVMPSTATPQASAPITINAVVDTSTLTAAFTDAIGQLNKTEQAALNISKESVKVLSAAIVDAIRVQNRQGAKVLG